MPVEEIGNALCISDFRDGYNGFGRASIREEKNFRETSIKNNGERGIRTPGPRMRSTP